MEDNLKKNANGRRHQFFQMEDNLKMQPKTIKVKTMVVAPQRRKL